MAGPAGRNPGADGAAGVGDGGRGVDVRRRGGAGVRVAADGGAVDRQGGPRPLVQPLRPAARLAGDDAAPGGGGVVLLPAFLYGPAARGRLAEDRGEEVRSIHT